MFDLAFFKTIKSIIYPDNNKGMRQMVSRGISIYSHNDLNGFKIISLDNTANNYYIYKMYEKYTIEYIKYFKK